jgi:hypothetical protein
MHEILLRRMQVDCANFLAKKFKEKLLKVEGWKL